MTKKLMALALGGAAVLMASPALADGYAAKAAPVACCEANWNGIYVGAAIGVAAFITKQTDVVTPPGAPPGIDPFDGVAGRGFLGSVAVGLDRQIAPGIVVGIFADYDFTDAEFNHTNGINEKIRMNDIWSVGARVGLARSCCALWYVTAGYTSADFKYHFADTASYNFNTRVGGWFAGLGAEQQIGRGLALKLEYRFSRFDDTSFSFVDGGGARHDVTKDPELHTIRLGLTYKFDVHTPRAVPLK